VKLNVNLKMKDTTSLEGVTVVGRIKRYKDIFLPIIVSIRLTQQDVANCTSQATTPILLFSFLL
jgi:hypothetical protein